MLDQVVQVNTNTFKYTLESKLKKIDPEIKVRSEWEEFTASSSRFKDKRRKYVIVLNSPVLSDIAGYKDNPVTIELFLEENNFTAIQTFYFGSNKADSMNVIGDVINGEDISLRPLDDKEEQDGVGRIRYRENIKVLTKSKLIPNIETLYNWGKCALP